MLVGPLWDSAAKWNHTIRGLYHFWLLSLSRICSRFINVMYLLTCIFICLFIYVFHTCRWYLRVEFDDRGLHTYRTETLSLVGHLVAKAWTAAGKLRDRKRGGMICDTDPPHRIFWRRKWNVGNSWTLPRRWALSRHDKEMHSFL